MALKVRDADYTFADFFDENIQFMKEVPYVSVHSNTLSMILVFHKNYIIMHHSSSLQCHMILQKSF